MGFQRRKKKQQQPNRDYVWRGHKLSKDQSDAVERILNSKSEVVFLTGKAGSGKSTVVDYIRTTVPRVAITATTGMAAQIVQGTTLHSFAGIIPNNGAIDSDRADARIRGTDILVVDEASMMDYWLLCELFKRFQLAKHQPKVLLVGDYLQLPPVDGTPLYKTELWPDIELVKLTSYHRQSDPLFIEFLNNIRCGVMNDDVMKFFENHRQEPLPDDCVHLMSLRARVEARNEAKLKELPGFEHVLDWRFEKFCPEKIEQNKINAIRLPERLRLKIGARVVLLNNDPKRRWVNGSTGKVVEIGDYAASIGIDLDNGGRVWVEKSIEEIVKGDYLLAQVMQFPMQLAWAMTIHKAQGCTLDKVGIDLNNHFECGQTYVAMSRCRTPQGISVCGTPKEIRVDPMGLQLFE